MHVSRTATAGREQLERLERLKDDCPSSGEAAGALSPADSHQEFD